MSKINIFKGTHKEVLEFILDNKHNINIIGRSCKTERTPVTISSFNTNYGYLEDSEVHSVTYTDKY